MPKVFLSHCSKDKQIVLRVRDYLRKSFLDAWLDEEAMSGGERIIEDVLPAIQQSRYFVLFISNHYLNSTWCNQELSEAMNLNRTRKNVIIPVLLENESNLQFDAKEAINGMLIRSIIQQVKYIKYDIYNPEPYIESIANACWKNEPVKFDPIQTKNIGGATVQIINFQLQQQVLPDDFLKNWDINILKFRLPEKNMTPIIQENIPVAFLGRAPNWLYAYLSIPFKNLNDVFLYNNVSESYICVYSKNDKILGKALKSSTS